MMKKSNSSSSSSSSSLLFVVDYLEDHDRDHNYNHDQKIDEEEKPIQQAKKARKKRASINSNSTKKCPISTKTNNASTTNGRSSIYRGVTRHRWTGRFEAHLWDKASWNNIQTKKGRQVYLGAYDNEVDAGRTYDLAALKYWGPKTTLNFQIENYVKEIEEMQNVSNEEYLASLRRRSSGFSRGVSKYRGVARHHHNGRWEARIGRVFGNKYLYLGTFSSQEEAAEAYDLAAIEYRGPTAVTNFDINNYIGRVKSLMTKGDCQEHEQVLKQDDEEQMAIMPLKLEESKLIVNPNEVINVDDSNEDPWSFCLDFDLDLFFNDAPLEEDGRMLELFCQHTELEEDIDFIFDEGEGGLISMDEIMAPSSTSSVVSCQSYSSEI